MTFTFIRLAGFRGVRNAVTVQLPRGFAIITGANGAGKSTICDGIEYALSGQIARFKGSPEGRESYSDYLWWRGGGRVEERFVEVGIRTDEGEEIVVRREPSGLKKISEEKLSKLVCGSATSVSYDAQNLCRTTIIRGDQIAELSLDLPEAERFRFVKDAVGTLDLSPLEEKATDVSKHFKLRATTLDLDYQRIRGAIAQIAADISRASTQVSDSGDLAGAEAALRTLLPLSNGDSAQVVSVARRELISCRSQMQSLGTLARRISEIEAGLQSVRTADFVAQVDASARTLENQRRQIADLESRSVELESRIRQQQGNQTTIEAWTQLAHYATDLGLDNGKCPLCASPVTPPQFAAQLEALTKRVAGENSILTNLLQERTRISAQLTSVRNDSRAVERQFNDLRARAEALTGERDRIVTEIGQLLPAAALPQQNDLVRLQNVLDGVKARAQVLEANLVVLESSKTVERIADLRKQLEELSKQSSTIDQKISRNRTVSDKFREAAAVLKRVSGELVDERLAQLSPLLRELYSRLRPHVEWTEISYLIRGDVRRFLSLQVGDELNPKFVFSNGQRRAAGLAFLLAVHLSRPWCTLRSLVLDDPVQHIDDFRALHLVEVLAAIRRSGRQILCTIEDTALARLLCRRLRSSPGKRGR